ncbi:dihydrodipicolinate synthase family protein [Ureibacillus composti]|nr:dihydrodipicolinate synthase family protein [Ureibacillus composti]
MLKGIIPPLVTFFDEMGSLDIEKNLKLIDILIEKDVDGLLLLGSSGEFTSMTHQQKKQYVNEVIPYINQRVKCIVNVGSNVVEEAIDLAIEVEKLGADAVLIVNPFYWPLNDTQMVDYYSKIIQSTELDAYLYNVPMLSSQEVPIRVITELLEKHENLKGIKETISDIGRYRKLIEQIRPNYPDFVILTGFDDHFTSSMLIGTNGSINSTAVVFPEISVNLQRALDNQNFEEVKYYQNLICEAMQLYDINNSFFSTFKEAVSYRWFNNEQVYHKEPFNIINPSTNSEVQRIVGKIDEKLKQVLLLGD